jgi:hypothetical protein
MRTRTVLPVLGLILVCVGAAYAVAKTDLQEIQGRLPTTMTDLTTVSNVEVRAADQSVVLSGQFGAATTTGTEIERHATLNATGSVAAAKGTAEIEIVRNGQRTESELEIDVEGLTASTSYVLVVDGVEATTFKTDPRGRAEVELKNDGAAQ